MEIVSDSTFLILIFFSFLNYLKQSNMKLITLRKTLRKLFSVLTAHFIIITEIFLKEKYGYSE
jgi:hypothetical protein